MARPVKPSCRMADRPRNLRLRDAADPNVTMAAAASFWGLKSASSVNHWCKRNGVHWVTKYETAIRADERERLAKLAEGRDATVYWDNGVDQIGVTMLDGPNDLAAWIRSQGEPNDQT